jgi:uncharacterized phage protein (TIGR02220 family)
LVSTCFWDDSYIIQLDPNEKLLFLYLLTNPLTNICGVYQISLQRMAFDTGLKLEIVQRLLKRFETDERCLFRDGWIAMRNWLKHQNAGSPKVKQGIEMQLKAAPPGLADYVSGNGIYTISHLNLNSNLNSNLNLNLKNTLSGCKEQPDDEVAGFIKKQEQEERHIPVKEIIDHLNSRCKTNYRSTATYVRRLVKARWNEGFRLNDFRAVIDVKAKQWEGEPKMVGYLRPATLFAPSHFDGYLNEAEKNKVRLQQICKECGGRDGRHIESCSLLRGKK